MCVFVFVSLWKPASNKHFEENLHPNVRFLQNNCMGLYIPCIPSKSFPDRSITKQTTKHTSPKTTYAGMAIAVWGGSDDIRRTPSLKLLLMIAPHGCCSLYGRQKMQKYAIKILSSSSMVKNAQEKQNHECEKPGHA